MTEQWPSNHEQVTERQIVIKKNLGQMDDGMRKLLISESQGGNSGRMLIGQQRYVAQGANGYIHPVTGEILVFGNPQDVGEEVKVIGKIFLLQVARNTDYKYYVAKVFDATEVPSEAKEILEETVEEWNAREASQAWRKI